MADSPAPSQPLWVFGYGSLMWDPGFEHAECHTARLDGYQRRFCLWSIRYRGTPESPGLVLGLDEDPAASCVGMAYRIAPEQTAAVSAYLKDREMVTYAYQETKLPVSLLRRDGSEEGRVPALCYILDPTHAQYAGALTARERAEIVIRSCGAKGDNLTYLNETVRHLHELGVHDAELEEFNALVHELVQKKE